MLDSNNGVDDEDETVMKIEFEDTSSTLVGLFLKHQQNLIYFDWSEGQRRNRKPSPPTVLNPLNSSSPAKKKASNVNHNTSPRLVRYSLNPSLFAIAEPYFMKSERAALLSYIETLRLDGQNSNDPTGLATNGNSKETIISKSAENRNKKRKRQVVKKVAYLDANLNSRGERFLVSRLLQRYLAESFEMTIPNGDGRIDEKLLLEHMATWESNGSNEEAQKFVESLFNNRFETLNYQAKLFSNPFDEVIKAKFGLSTYLIPARCSFAGVDIVDGVRALCRHLKIASVSGDPQTVAGLISTAKPFMLVLDPAWEKNKSVKRKKTYETVSYDYLERMSAELKSLLDCVVSLRCEALRKQKGKTLQDNELTVLTALWTTKGDRDFVLDKMLPTLGLRLAFELKWHKVTTNGLPVKIHGGLEYLMIAERRVATNENNRAKPRSGVLVSIPSAIHSHKPPVVSLLNRLYKQEIGGAGRRHRTSSVTSSDDHQLFQYDLVPNEFLAPLEGLELFARSLTTGFHSIGHECIKLQNDKLFVMGC